MLEDMHENIDVIGARLIDPHAGIDRISDLYVRKGKLYHEKPTDEKAHKVIDGKNNIVLPGLLDLRAHSRIPGDAKAETIASLTQAAAKGGFTSILTMPDTYPHCDNPATIRYIQDRVNQASKIKVYLSGSLTLESKGESMAPLGSLKDVGVVAVTDCPSTPQNNQILLNAIKYADMFGLVVIDFPQDGFLTNKTLVHESALSLKMGLTGNARMAEEIAVQRSILISSSLGIALHLSSLSSGGSVRLVKNAKKSGIKITADVSANHLLLNQNEISDYKTNAKTNPPLREEEDRLALVNGLIDGTLDACNSSHQPYAEHHKNIEFDLAPSGAIGLETATLAFLEATQNNDPYNLVAEKMSYNPHKILCLNPPSLKSGDNANFTIIKTNEPWVYNTQKGLSLSNNTPLNNYPFNNKIIFTYGESGIAYEDNSHIRNS